MKNISIHVFALLLCQLFFVQNSFASDFKIVKKQGDIILYERWITDTKGESVRELKAEFLVKSNTENIIDLLKNQPEGTKWNRNASEYRIVNTHNNERWINYIKYDMPAIMDDQECCLLYRLHSSFSQQQNICVISFESTLCPLFPVNSDVTRITGVRGRWILEQLSNENMKVTYIISSDKSSNIPRFISDPIVHNNLFKTMANFKTLLEK